VASSAGFGRITRGWRNEDVVHIYLPMPVQRVLAHPGVAEDRDRAAFHRGPLVFALEGVDNGVQYFAWANRGAGEMLVWIKQ
jgi:DUF1680 family protein